MEMLGEAVHLLPSTQSGGKHSLHDPVRFTASDVDRLSRNHGRWPRFFFVINSDFIYVIHLTLSTCNSSSVELRLQPLHPPPFLKCVFGFLCLQQGDKMADVSLHRRGGQSSAV